MQFFRALSVARSAVARRSYATEASSAGKLRVTFALPHQAILKNFDATQVNIQSSEGDMGILADHVPTIAQLQNGSVVEIFAADNKIRKYFVSGGFAVMNIDSSLNINAVEAFELDKLDAEAARKGADEASKVLASTSASDKDKATARIQHELYEAVIAAAKA
ncbi:delta subunit of the central stalk of mitochondrial F1F0 ATP synthase, atp16 [Podochytrium sp. JEL0797]|nr:delta subunit of the central stalk of mitochondrial F1F0 ATP synthase, atp16 [Podochytrium sp. JEL0797]